MTQLQCVSTTQRWGRRTVVMATLLFSGAAFAQGFPSKPIRIIVPYAPSGILDMLARYVAANMSETIGQQVIVENKPGAGGIIAAQYVARAPADGYTVFFVANSDYAITPALHSHLPYDPARDFAPVTQALRGYMSLVANAGFGAKTVKDLIAQAKTRPGKINYGSPGNGTMHHLGMEQFKRSAKVDLMHVPYKGVTQATPALVVGDISVMFATMASVSSYVRSGQLNVLAVASPHRSATRPDLPTVAESGLPGFVMESNMGFVVPAGTPRPIIDRLNTEIGKALKTPNMKSKLLDLDAELIAGTPEQFGEQIRKDQEFYARLVRETGLNID
jgi:tripartite-type tricarboxylate transporter receptor subunit TctC